jgi:hypothetical protein
MLNWCVTGALLIALLLQTILHHFERKDLYNRIMAQSLTEYKRSAAPPGKVENSIKKNFTEFIEHG